MFVVAIVDDVLFSFDAAFVAADLIFRRCHPRVYFFVGFGQRAYFFNALISDKYFRRANTDAMRM